MLRKSPASLRMSQKNVAEVSKSVAEVSKSDAEVSRNVTEVTRSVARVSKSVETMLGYFENTYIGQLKRGRRRRPLFAHSMLNISSRVADDLPQTTKALEGWHKQLNRCFAVAHPTIWTFIKVLRNDAALNQIRVAHFDAGRQPPKRRRIYDQINDRIRTLHTDYNNREIIDYLRGISYNISN